MKTYQLSDFNYNLPEKNIAQTPLKKRDTSNLLIPHLDNRLIHFHELDQILGKHDVLVLNQTRVFKARFKALCKRTQRTHEVLFSKRINQNIFEAMIFNTKKLKLGDELSLCPEASIKLIEKKSMMNIVEYQGQNSIDDIFNRYGIVPLPPYIKRTQNKSQSIDEQRYQTVYSKDFGSCAAPTAGLHFTDELLNRLEKQEIQITTVTLHVGPGTFLPVKNNDISKHKMHSEFIEMNEKTAQILNDSRKQNKKIICVGTTSLRVLETCYTDGQFIPQSGETDIYIYPPHKVKSADALITNFHQPMSSLLMLVSAFSGFEQIKSVYKKALELNMRFLSYGDAVFLNNQF